MRAIGYIVATLTSAIVALAAPARAQDVSRQPGPHLRIALVAESDTPKAGSEVAIALDTTPQPGWHGYWRNPGDAGFPAKLDWTLPAGVTVGEPAYPAPQRLLISGLMNYVFERPYAAIVKLKVPRGLAEGTTLPISLHMAYLVCTTQLCGPEQGDFAITLTVGDGAIDPTQRAVFDAWRRALPQPLGAPATYQAANGEVRIAAPYPADAKGEGAYFYPLSREVIDYAAPQMVRRDGDRLILITKGKGGGPIEGVLSVDGRALAMKASPGVVAMGSGPSSGGDWAGAALAFAAAVLGGLLLHVMPCVFPILRLKALSLARAGGDERGPRREALAYASGAVVMCLALGATILALRTGGGVVGWAFQLQDPRVVILLLLLTVGISLNLAGVFELPTPRFASKAGGASGAFATGALAAFVATPCAGPFMGVALGAALVLPWPAALAVFAGLGLGLALPFLLLGFVPALRRKLPRPGAWMEVLRRILSIPMWVTAVALAWLLGKQAGVNGMALALLVALGCGLVLWAVGRRQTRGLAVGAPTILMLVAIATAGVWLMRPVPKIVEVASDQAFSEARLAELRKEGRPVFVYFTADWCLTCKVNERVAIDTDRVQAAFHARKIAVLVGDWTNGDPTLGRFIEAHNRAGVPLYLFYPAGGGAPRILPQILTPSMLEEL
ncbi:MAG: thioredoxin family protein [Proteobacteria bacterium]|nr:thioredoxin family protein [Pseudomonadota bacterium]